MLDSENFFERYVILKDTDETPTNCVEVELQEGLYKPKWNGTEWEEGLKQEEIDAIVNVPVPKSEMEILKEENERLKVSIYEMTTYAASQDEQITRQNQAILELTTLITGGNA